jgi:capsular exopolysaccharide synthesis family protein
MLDDYCQQLLRRLDWPGDGRNKPALRTLGVTSCRGGEGVSTVAAHLAAAAAARQDGRVLLVDANLNRPAAAKVFGVSDSPGLFECIAGGESLLDVVQPTSMENLYVLTAGKVRGSPARIYDADSLAEVISELSAQSTLTIFDLPPVRQASCANRLTAALDGVLLVLAAESVTWQAAARVQEILQRGGASVLGVVMNKHREG